MRLIIHPGQAVTTISAPGCLDAVHLLVGDLLRKIIVIDTEGTSHAAADIGIGHLHIVEPFEALRMARGWSLMF